ncbi:MAG: hypothetical protein CL789_01385 [Chloroflexi bacterium]|nr:hypothetical protein [Chloroflexota bacterium]HCU81197.1 hypothetical protein [Chloroflexota bacterium]
MNGFGGIGGWEFLLIAVIAILVLGPERMIHYAFRAGRFARKMSAYWQEGAAAFRAEVHNIKEDANSHFDDIRSIGGTKDITSDSEAYVDYVDSINTSMSGIPMESLESESNDNTPQSRVETKPPNDSDKEEYIQTDKKSSQRSDLYDAWHFDHTLDR